MSAGPALLQSLGNGVIFFIANAGAPAVPVLNHSVYVIERATPTGQETNPSYQVPVYTTSALSVQLSQPLSTGSNGAGPGGIPGYVAGEQEIDLYDATTGQRTNAEPVAAGDVSLKIASAYLAPSGGDDSAAMQNALTNFAPFAYPVVVLGPGIFQWNTEIPALARSYAARISGAGITKTTVRLSSSAQQLVTLNKIADGDSFPDVTIEDLTVDCNNITGLGHVVAGNYSMGGTLIPRINVSGWRVRRVRTINVPSQSNTSTYNTSTLHRLNVHFAISDSANQSTQYSITDMIVEDCDFQGGDEGVFIGGTVSGAVTGLNVWMDNCHVRRCTWTSGAVATQFFASAGFQLGSCAFGGRCTIEDCHAAFSGDVGFEIDTLMKVDVVNCSALDCWNHGFYMKNVQYVGPRATTPYSSSTAQTNGQSWTFDSCKAERLTVTNQMTGFRIDTLNSVPVGNVTLKDPVWHRDIADFTSTTGEMFLTIGTVGHVRVQNPSCVIEGMSATGTSQTVTLFSADGAGPTTFKIKDATVRLQGANTSGNTQTIRVAEAYSNTISPMTTYIEWDGLFVDPSFSSGNFAIVIAQAGQSSANTTNIGGLIRRGKFNASAGFSSSWTGVVVGSSTHTTIAARTALRLEECDFSAVNGNPISIGSGNLTNVVIDRCGPPRTPVSASYTVLQTDETVAYTSTSSAYTATLPPTASAAAGKIIVFVDESNAAATHNITIACAGADTFLGGGTTKTISANGGDFKCYSNGTVWVPAA